jgi:hypothetical protein
VCFLIETLKEVFEPERDEKSGNFRVLYNKEFCDP